MLRSLRPLRFLKPGNHSVCKVQAVFLFLEANEAVEVIEASDVIRTVEVIEATQILKINNKMKKSLKLFKKIP